MKNNLTEGSVWKVLLRFTIPFLLSGLFQVAYGTVDVYFLGHYGQGASLAGVSSASQAMSMLTFGFMGLATGGTVLIGQSVGAKDDKTAGKATGNIITIFACVAVFCTAILLLLHSNINNLMNVPEDAKKYANDYLLVCGLGSVFIMGYNVASSILCGLGNSKAPLYFVAAGCVANIVVDYIFVAKLNMNAVGAALATVLAQAVSLIFAIIYIKVTKLPFSFSKRDLILDKATSGRILKIGVPAALQQSLIGFSFNLITTITNGMGVAAAGGCGVVGKAVDLCMMIPSSFSSAITSITAQNVGAGKPERALKSMWYGVLLSLVFAVPYMLLGTFKPEFVVGILSSDPAVIEAGARYLIPFSWDCVLVSFVFCMNGYFNGRGKSLFTMAHNISTTFLVRIPIVWFASRAAGATLFEVGLGTPIATFASLIICLVYLQIMRKQAKPAANQ
ncbi:MAG: MATE family efflux transporter [Oscillospiraceae bacterium]|jgi:putative MATE family efflux protein|nr:MATE family efflux transporter [Oscillospiraceae bacterium]